MINKLPQLWKDCLNINGDEFYILEMGGHGDCFFFVLSAALNKLPNSNMSCSAKDVRNILASSINENDYENTLFNIQDSILGLPNNISILDFFNFRQLCPEYWLLVA